MMKKSNRKTHVVLIKATRNDPAKNIFFDELLNQYHQKKWLNSDPIQFAHRYTDRLDQEVVAFVSALFAYGSVSLINRAIASVLKPMGNHPYEFIKSYSKRVDHWHGFSHRFHKSAHLQILFLTMNRFISKHGSLGMMFETVFSEDDSLEISLNKMAKIFWNEFDHVIEEFDFARKDVWRGMRFFINAPEGGSACKRMVMFLRWMGRKDDIDFGLWSNWLNPRDLIVPLDTHVSRISYYLKLRKGKESKPANWAMAVEVTQALACICPEDPVKYDFALARLGILDICQKKWVKSVCEKCPLIQICRYPNLAK